MKYEYKVLHFLPEANTQILNELGAEGWRICGVTSGPQRIYLIRPIFDKTNLEVASDFLRERGFEEGADALLDKDMGV